MSLVHLPYHGCANLSLQLSRAVERRRRARRMLQLRKELTESAPAFMRSGLVDVIASRTAFVLSLLEGLEEQWLAGEPFDARQYSIINQCAVKMLADTAKRTTFELVNP